MQKPLGTHILTWKGTPVDVARNRLVKDAREMGAKYLFFLDDDVLPPPEALMTLMWWRLPIVSGLYWAKTGNPAVWRKALEGPNYVAYSPQPNDVLVEAHALPAGCLLIDMRVFDVIPEPWFVWDMPDPKTKKGLSEDFYFSRLASQHGFRLFLDARVKCRHEAAIQMDPEGKYVVKPSLKGA